MFGTALPLVAGLAIAVVPLQLGARAIAFPRLVAAGMYMWLGGFVLSIVSLINNGGFGGGNSDMVDLFLAAHGLMALGFTAVGVSLVTSVLTTRAPGMTMRRVPFFAFSALVFGIGLVLVMPVLVGAVIYLFVDHRSGAREAFGGNRGIVTWAGWIFTQPTTFLFAIPVLGLFAELLPVTFRKRATLRGVVFGGLALVGVSALAAVTQQLRFDVPWEGSQLSIADGDDFGTKLGDVAPWAMFHLLPLLGAGILFLMMLFLAKPEQERRRRDDQAQHHRRIPVRLLRLRDDPRRDGRRRDRADRRSRPDRHRVRRGVARLRRLRHRARCDGRCRLLGTEALGPHARHEEGRPAGAARRHRHRPGAASRTTSPASSTSPPASSTTTATCRSGTSSCSSATG